MTTKNAAIVRCAISWIPKSTGNFIWIFTLCLASIAHAGVTVDDAGSERNGRVGAFSSLVAAGGEVAISYYCELDPGGPSPATQALRFAWKTPDLLGGGCWRWTNVAVGASFPSMARDAAGLYHIIFEGHGGLSWATGHGYEWSIATTRVDSGMTPSHASMALDAQGRPHVAYFDSDADGAFALKYTEWNGTAWMRGDTEVVAANVWTPTIGCSNAYLALDPSGVPHVVFAEPTDGLNAYGEIKYATLQDGVWSIEWLGVQGVDPSLAIGSDGVPHVTFRQGGVLAYATRPHATWQVETVAVGDPGVSEIGSVSLTLGPLNVPRVAFARTGEESMMLATRLLPGLWVVTPTDIGGAPTFGRIYGRLGAAVAVDAGGFTHVCYTAMSILDDASGSTVNHSDLRYFTSGLGLGNCVIVTGACCSPATGSCQAIEVGACDGGRVWSAGPCEPNPCPAPPTGACCQPATGTCAMVAHAMCAFGSTWSLTSTCTPAYCSPPVVLGACCRGTMCQVTTAPLCTGANTRYVGVGSACNALASLTTPCCKADFDQNGVIGVPDIFAFLTAWFAGSPLADMDGLGCDTVQDVFLYLAAWFGGC